MSLLMEALRKAEDAKRKSQDQESRSADAAPDAGNAAPAPVAALRSATTLEPREMQRDELQDYLAADPVQEDNTPLPRPGRKPGSPRQSSDQLAAAAVFAAKQAPRHAAQQKHVRVMTLLGLGLMVSLGGGATLWYLQNTQSSGLAINPALANYDLDSRRLADEQTGAVDSPAPASADVQAPLIGATAQGQNGTRTGAEPAEATASRALAASSPPERGATDDPPATGAELAKAAFATLQRQPPEPALPEPGAAEPPVVPPVTAATAAPEGTAAGQEDVPPLSARTLEITRSGRRSAVNNTLQSAWSTLQSGNPGSAALLYEEVLTQFPNNRDALIGLAAINLRNGQIAIARQQYAQLLTLNPKDPYAQAGLLQATRNGNNTAHEAELKSLLQRYPDLAPLHFSLGNLFAGQQRWSEAQGAYFDALRYANHDTANPVSPDYAFNLAVSLEQLQQPQAALTYYRQALELSRSSPPGYDPAQLQSRLAFLEQMQP